MNSKLKLGDLASGLNNNGGNKNEESKRNRPDRHSAIKRAAHGLIGGEDYLRNRDFSTILEVDPERVQISDRHDRLMNLLTENNTRELIESIRAQGQIVPAIARPVDNVTGKANYEIIAGARRWWVARHLGIKLRIEIKDIDDAGAFKLNYASNRHSDVSAYEAARYIVYGLKTYYDDNQRKMEQAIGISHQKIGRYMCMYEIPDVVIEAVEDPRQLTLDHAERLRKYLREQQTKKAILREAEALSKREELYNARRLVSRLLMIGQQIKTKNTGKDVENWIDDRGAYVATLTHTKAELKIRIPSALAKEHQNEIVDLLHALGLEKEVVGRNSQPAHEQVGRIRPRN